MANEITSAVTRLRERLLPSFITLNALGFVLILTFYCTIQIFLWQQHAFPLTRGETDGIEYMLFATGPIFHLSPYHGPGYPLVIRVVSFISGLDLFRSAKLVSVFAGVIFILSSWRLFRVFLDTEIQALAALFIFAANSIFLITSNLILSDALGAALFYASLAFVLQDKTFRMSFFLAGIVGGLAYLSRYVYGLLLFLPLIWLVIGFKQGFLRWRFLRVVEYIAGFFLTVLPWLLFLYNLKHDPFWNQNYLNIAYRMYHYGQGWNLFPDESQYSSMLDVVMHNPQVFFTTWLNSIYSFPQVFIDLVPNLGLISLPGLYFWLRKLNDKKLIYLVLIFMFAVLISLFWFENRFLLIFIPFISQLIACCLIAISNILRRSAVINHNLKVILLGCIFIVCIFAAVQPLSKITERFIDQAKEYQKAAEWFLENEAPGIKIMAAKPHVAFFGRGKNIDYRAFSMQKKTLDDLACVLSEANPKYFIYDARYAAVEFPQYNILLNPEQNPLHEVLSMVYVVSDPRRLIIYRYNSEDNQSLCVEHSP